MSKQHPEKAQVVVGGQSYEGRQILGLRINTPTDEEKPVMFIESGKYQCCPTTLFKKISTGL